jgi:hypothetical protein
LQRRLEIRRVGKNNSFGDAVFGARIAFTLQTYAHVIPAMDEQAAATAAAYILSARATDGSDGSILWQVMRTGVLSAHVRLAVRRCLRIPKRRLLGGQSEWPGAHRPDYTMLILINALDQGVTTRTATPWEQFISHVRAYKLDHDIAAGASPESSALLALRAQALVRPAMRQRLARSLEHLREGAEPRPGPQPSGLRVRVRRDRILGAADALQILIDRLVAPAPVPARGVAGVRILLIDGAGPLYYPSDNDNLSAHVLEIVEQLEPLDSW